LVFKELDDLRQRHLELPGLCFTESGAYKFTVLAQCLEPGLNQPLGRICQANVKDAPINGLLMFLQVPQLD
jgi:hypothetical protein